MRHLNDALNTVRKAKLGKALGRLSTPSRARSSNAGQGIAQDHPGLHPLDGSILSLDNAV